MQDPYGALVALVRFDNEINSKKQRIFEYTKAYEAIQLGIQAFKNVIAQLEEEKKTLGKRQYALDLDLRICEEDADRVAARLDAATGVKEFDALTHERELVEGRSAALESELESVWMAIGNADEQIVQQQKKIETFIKDNHADMVSLEESIDTLTRLIDEALARRPELVKKVHPESYEQYERMRSQINKPFVPLSETGACSACGNAVSHIDRAAVERHVLTPCQACRRILYDDRVSE